MDEPDLGAKGTDSPPDDGDKPLAKQGTAPPTEQQPLDVSKAIKEKFGAADDDLKKEDAEGEEEGDDQQVDKEEPDKKDDADPDAALPFHKHPRFQEIIKEKNTLKGELEQTKPLAERMKVVDEFSRQYGITPELHKQALEIAALSLVDRQGYVSTLKKLLEQAELQTGEKLPADLAKEVEEGTISEARAKEIAQLRANKGEVEQNSRKSQEQLAQQRHNEIAATLNTWDSSKRQGDPDFKPKASATAEDGKYEWTLKNLTYLLQTEGAKAQSVADVVALAERAYKEASGLFSRGARRTNKLVDTNGSSTNNVKPELKPINVDDRDALRALVYKTAGAAR